MEITNELTVSFTAQQSLTQNVDFLVVVIYFDDVVSEVRSRLRLSLELLTLKHRHFSQILTVSQGTFELMLNYGS